MVLGALGDAISNALLKVNGATKIDETVFKTLLNDITRALLAADVSMELIQHLNTNVRKAVSFKHLPKSFDVRRMIEKVCIHFLFL